MNRSVIFIIYEILSDSSSLSIVSEVSKCLKTKTNCIPFGITPLAKSCIGTRINFITRGITVISISDFPKSEQRLE